MHKKAFMSHNHNLLFKILDRESQKDQYKNLVFVKILTSKITYLTSEIICLRLVKKYHYSL